MQATGNALLVGSIPLESAEEVLRAVAETIGDRVRRIPDGETGQRSDWIVWQYPVLNACQQFEVCPPGDHLYRSLPRLRLRQPELASGVSFGELGYAAAASSSYQTFAKLKRDGVVPEHCRFQVSLPTPLSPISAFVDHRDQAVLEPAYEDRLINELDEIAAAVPHDQLAIQWDANFEFAMLDGSLPAWFRDVRAGIVERLLRLASHVPAEVELGYHFCHGHDRRYLPGGRDLKIQVDVANALAASLGRPLNWLHLPVPISRLGDADYEPLLALRLNQETELYLGLLSSEDGEPGARARIALAQRYIQQFGVATVCGWGRLSDDNVGRLFQLHADFAAPVVTPPRAPAFSWPQDFPRIPDAPWTTTPIDESGLAYDRVDRHSWYSNLEPTVTELEMLLRDGGLLVDYSGGTGILLDRLKLRLFGARVGTIIVDSSPKFLRVALEKFRDDTGVAFRQLRLLREEGRLERLDEVLDKRVGDRGVDVIASTNAIHLYPDLPDTVGAWTRVLRPGGKVLVSSGNIRNPRAGDNQWILDQTVWVISDLAEGIVRSDDAYTSYRAALDDDDRMKQHGAFRDRVFLDPRPLSYYTDTLEAAGLRVDQVRESLVEAKVDDWYEFLCAYHDAVLGWVGGTERIEGAPPSAEAVRDRLRLMRQAIELLFGHRSSFHACWTYITSTYTGGVEETVAHGPSGTLPLL